MSDLLDGTLKIKLEHDQLELICLSILNANLFTNREFPKADPNARADEVYDLWDAIKTSRLLKELEKEMQSMSTRPSEIYETPKDMTEEGVKAFKKDFFADLMAGLEK
jgi:hypothetical protein